jgi:1,4-alpha-glucan branching enzyme
MALDLNSVPMGGTLVPGGATFRIWAPRAKAVYISGDFNNWEQDASCLLTRINGGHWAVFLPGFKDGDQYLFYVDGVGTSNYKRDPRGRLLTAPACFGIRHDFLGTKPAFVRPLSVMRSSISCMWEPTSFNRAVRTGVFSM